MTRRLAERSCLYALLARWATRASRRAPREASRTRLRWLPTRA